MKLHLLAFSCAALLLTACLSQSTPPGERFFRPPLAELSAQAVSGTRPLHLDRVQSPPFLSTRMLWRMSETEVAPDGQNSWAVLPSRLFEERLRDLLFSRGGYRESLNLGDPFLSVQLVTMEGDVEGGGSAYIEFTADFRSREGTQYRERFTAREPLESKSPAALASATATVIDRAAAALIAWVAERQ